MSFIIFRQIQNFEKKFLNIFNSGAISWPVKCIIIERDWILFRRGSLFRKNQDHESDQTLEQKVLVPTKHWRKYF